MGDKEQREAASEERFPLEMEPAQFRALGHELVDRIADFLGTIDRRPAAPNLSPQAARERVGRESLPAAGQNAGELLQQAGELLTEGCRINGHPRSWGYIIGSPAPIGMLGDLLASSVNPNLAAWNSAPVPTEMEAQSVRWIAELLGYPADCGGLLVSGGNAANFVGFLAARRAKAPWDLRRSGLAGSGHGRLRAYTSAETHTWVQKAADLFGLGTDAIRWVPTDSEQRMDSDALVRLIEADKAAGDLPFLVVGTAGTVSTGAVDPLFRLSEIAKAHDLWFHVDGAYGAPAVIAPSAPGDLAGLRLADSLAVDAHKWLFVPLEAGCALVRDRRALRDTFSFQPPYYHHHVDGAEEVLHYFEYGPQNSRCFRALKVWLALQQAGRDAYARIIERNIVLARRLRRRIAETPELENATQNLSITTFRFVPDGVDPALSDPYLNELNGSLLTELQRGGEAFLSNAIIADRFFLRVCITNFRSREADIDALPEIVLRLGHRLDRQMRQKTA